MKKLHSQVCLLHLYKAAFVGPINLLFLSLQYFMLQKVSPQRLPILAKCHLIVGALLSNQRYSISPRWNDLLQTSYKEFHVCCYSLSLLTVSCWMEEVALCKQPFIRACQASSHLTSAAIMQHQVGQLLSLAAEQGAQSGSKIKCAVSGFCSQELPWLMLYWLWSLPVSITNNNSQVNDRWRLHLDSLWWHRTVD